MTRLALALIATLGLGLALSQAASAKDFKAAQFGNRCWQPPVCPPQWNPCPPHWNPCPPQICPPHWNPCPPQWGIVPVPAVHPDGQAALQNATYGTPSFSQRNSSGIEASSLFNR